MKENNNLHSTSNNVHVPSSPTGSINSETSFTTSNAANLSSDMLGMLMQMQFNMGRCVADLENLKTENKVLKDLDKDKSKQILELQQQLSGVSLEHKDYVEKSSSTQKQLEQKLAESEAARQTDLLNNRREIESIKAKQNKEATKNREAMGKLLLNLSKECTQTEEEKRLAIEEGQNLRFFELQKQMSEQKPVAQVARPVPQPKGARFR